MNLHELKGTYDAVFSLGSNCYPAQRLERYSLRPYSGVIDWMYSNSIPGLVKLLNNRFDSFMHPRNLWVEGLVLNDHNYSVRDCFYDIQSVHDFLAGDRLDGIVQKYPQFKNTFERRIARFLEKTGHCRKLLFVRLHASYEDAALLEAALRSIVTHEFRLLVVNPGQVGQMIEHNWPLQYTCSLEMPIEWDERSDELWSKVFEHIQYEPPAP